MFGRLDPYGAACEMSVVYLLKFRKGASTRCIALCLILSGLLARLFPLAAAERVLDGNLYHLRAGDTREWSDFPERFEGPRLSLSFRANANDTEFSLRLRQKDVKQPWRVSLNQKDLGNLTLDENDTVVYFPVPPGTLTDGDNTLHLEPVTQARDDILLGQISLDSRPLKTVLSEATVDVHVFDATNPRGRLPTPCRITVVNAEGALVTTAATSKKSLAVRAGVIYSANGQATIGLPAGDYTLYAGRGFEFDVDSVRLSLKPGDVARKELTIRREVATEGYVSCDPHIHSLTYSGHGDATIGERVVTIAGEGIELPIATEHNRHVDYDAASRQHGVRRYFTPVVGNEVTTALGHFNIFPVTTIERVPDFQLRDGNAIMESIASRTRAQVIVLNHPRDMHSGFRPFGPERHNSPSGENSANWLYRAQAVELVNSGAQQSDWLQTYRDWFGLLNRGVFMTPIGASDSHDVSRHIVGQARTYIPCRDDRPGEIDVAEALENLLAGRALVSCGLLVEITVNGKYGPGDLVPAGENMRVTLRVAGPRWAIAQKVTLYVNGSALREEKIHNGTRGGVKWRGEWELPRFDHDVHLAAIASGPGVESLHWPIAKPYQPTSPVVERRVIASTGAVWLDADGDGERTSALAYAQRLMTKHGNSPSDVAAALASYDEAVAVQAAALLNARSADLNDSTLRSAARKAGPQVDRGFRAFLEAWRTGEVARSQ